MIKSFLIAFLILGGLAGVIIAIMIILSGDSGFMHR